MGSRENNGAQSSTASLWHELRPKPRRDLWRLERQEELLAFLARRGVPRQFDRLVKTSDCELILGDLLFLLDRTAHMRGERLTQMLMWYVEAWRHGMVGEDRSLQKQADGRRKANAWLRNYVPREEDER